MGVLNFAGTVHQNASIPNIFSFGVNPDIYVEQAEVDVQQVQSAPRNKRRRTKSGCKYEYNFKDYGIDARRRGSKHQRRKQNFDELQKIAGDDTQEESLYIENQMTVFTELFLDESKMKVWEGFIALSEDKQGQYMDEFETRKVSTKSTEKDPSDGAIDENDGARYLLIDQKIRDMLRSKQLSKDVNGLLKYYEDDLLSCINDISSPAVLIFDLEDAYDRMLVYAICQYMKISSNTIKLKTSTIIEIDIDVEVPVNFEKTLTEYLQAHVSNLR